jgi:serine/threonine protein kinase
VIFLCVGFEYLHTKYHPTIIHHGVKTSNALFTKQLDAKVVDFGIFQVASH